VVPKKILIAAVLVVGTIGFALYAARHPMDFRVYYYGARGVFDGSRPAYGLTSGLGWPMHYRYPPLFLLIFAPFAALPLSWGAAVWVVLKIFVLVSLLKALYSAAHFSIGSSVSCILAFLFIAPYIVEELRYGNAQFFVFALSAAALLIGEKRPALAAASLAFGISIKVWPLFFLPYLVVRRNWKVVAYTLAFVALLAVLPGIYFGFGNNLKLLGQWFSQEFQTQLGESEIWFPNQSLRGVLMRYLTVIDYSRVPDSNYARVNVVALAPSLVRMIWLGICAAMYAGFLWLANRRRSGSGWLDHGLAFCLVAVLEPFTQKYAMVSLLWPALAVAGLFWKSHLRFLFYLAITLALVQPLTPGADAQRLLQVLGLDFFAAGLLTTVLATACLVRRG
jgi:hypothetical protein